MPQRSIDVSWSKRQERAGLGADASRAHLERYELMDELGQGGMSVVFRARDKQLGRDVAVKLLHDFLARQEDARKRFHREAVAVARLRHPGIVEIYDYSGPDAEDAYIVCEIIEGLTLRAFVDTFGPPQHPELGVLVVQELVRALRHAHEQGIVHRDVKPENVMITDRGQLKLMDFGIAQIMEGATKLTATGTLLGSPAHMAPEVIDGKVSDHRSDIFSVGTMLYWLCAGQLPFAAPNPSALFRLILEGTYEPPQLLNPRIGNGLARILERALEPDPEARYQDISELQTDLQKELDEVGLEPADSLAKQFLSEPEEFTERWRPALIETLVARGQCALTEGHVGRAMDRFNRVLAIDPEHPEVRRLVSQIGRRERMHRNARRAVVFFGGTATIAALAWGTMTILPDLLPEPEPAPIAKLVEDGPASTVRAAPPPATPRVEEPAAVPKILAARNRPRPRPGTTARAMKTGRPVEFVVDAPAERDPGSAVAAAEPTNLRVKIGPGWGNIRINGSLRRSAAYGGSFALKPGRHTIEVFRPDGRHTPRTVEVSAAGDLFEVVEGGRKRSLVARELLFRMPGRGGTVPGWIPSQSEEARAPANPTGGG